MCYAHFIITDSEIQLICIRDTTNGNFHIESDIPNFEQNFYVFKENCTDAKKPGYEFQDSGYIVSDNDYATFITDSL